jgi:GNAT superfamily N-acetyltransferase
MPTPPTYTIRLARPEEVAGLPALEDAAAELFERIGMTGDFLDTTRTVEELDAAQREARLWVAADREDRPVGFALATVLGDAPHLEELAVHPEHGRRGLGRRLVAAVVEWARARGAPTLTLSTFRDVPWNAPFYARLGFVALDHVALPARLAALVERERAHGLPVEQRVVMQRELEEAR